MGYGAFLAVENGLLFESLASGHSAHDVSMAWLMLMVTFDTIDTIDIHLMGQEEKKNEGQGREAETAETIKGGEYNCFAVPGCCTC